MKTFSQYIQEHNPLAVKSIVKKINPLDKQMKKLNRMRKLGITGMAKQAVMKNIFKGRPSNKEKKQWKDKNTALGKERDKWKQKYDQASKKKGDAEDKVYRWGWK